MRRTRGDAKWMSFVALFVGGILLLLDVCGCFLSLRSPELDRDPLVRATDPVRIGPAELQRQIRRRSGEPESGYARRLTALLDAGVAHYWDDEGTDRYHLRIPVWENWILYTLSFVKPSIFRKYELTDPDKAVERGVGLCSQQALTLQLLLRRERIRADVIFLNGHVVDQVHPRDGKEFVADPDAGVVFDGSIFDIQRDPASIRQRYAERFGRQRRDFQEYLSRVLLHHPVVVGPAETYVDPRVFLLERISWSAKWLIPCLLICAGILSARNRRGEWQPTGRTGT